MIFNAIIMIKDLLKNKKFIWILAAIAAIIPLEILSLFSIHLPLLVELPVFLLILLFFGRSVFASGAKSLLKLNFSNINLLMAIAIFGAAYLGEFEEAAIIVTLFALGEFLEEFGIKRSRSALEKLVQGAPKKAEVKGKGNIPVEGINVGEIVIIKPGSEIPLDGEVIKGSSLVDEAMITGEPLPKNKFTGDDVYAGTLNKQGYLEIKVGRKSADSTLAKIIEFTYKAAERKLASQKFIEKFAKFYTPSIMAVSLALVVIPVFVMGKPFNIWLTQALSLLIISCPCALVISTPIAAFSAIGNASQRGALIKGGRFIEEIGKVKAVAFDKTRTLTKGDLIVSDIIPFNGFTQEEVISCAAGMEYFSEHPIAKSIINEARERNAAAHSFNNFKSVRGKGVTGECLICSDSHHCMGNISFITEEHKAGEEVLNRVRELEAQGKTAVVMSDSKKIKGIIGIVDEVREESKEIIGRLKRMDVVPIMLTGDNNSAAKFVAREVGIEVVRAELLPMEKERELKNFMRRYGNVAMTGDGVNDAPALASSSVGIAMGAVGSDAAIENADIALMNDDLKMIPYLVGLGKETANKIKVNIFSSVLVKALFLALAIGGMSNLAMAIFADTGVAVLVIMNSLSLYGYSGKTGVKCSNADMLAIGDP